METNLTTASNRVDSSSSSLLDHLHTNQDELQLDQATVYYDFPLFRSQDGSLVSTGILVGVTHSWRRGCRNDGR